MDAWPTSDAGDADVELDQLLAGPLDTLVNRLDDLFGVLLHPPGSNTSILFIENHGGEVEFKVWSGLTPPWGSSGVSPPGAGKPFLLFLH